MAKNKMVKCRYPKCSKLHETTELKKEDAVKGGNNSYYHPDCYHIMKTVTEIRDLYVKNINPAATGQQIGAVMSITNNMIFEKHIDADLIKFAAEYFVKYKPGIWKYPAGIAYLVQDKDVATAWNKEKQRKLREEQKSILVNDEFRFDMPESNFVYKPQKARSFEDILK